MSEQLQIKHLCVDVAEQTILRDLELSCAVGQVHAIMGPNGSGKSTLAQVLAGSDSHQVKSGSIHFKGHDLLALKPHERARLGVFLGFQYPVEIPGISNVHLLKEACNARRKALGLPDIDAMDFLQQVKQYVRDLHIDEDMLYRSVNEGFSGGEKKRNEILQMLVLQPELIILDEIDSGLDIDSLQVIAKMVNQMRSSERLIILITHYQRLLDYIEPDHIHILSEGKVVHSGSATLARRLEQIGYQALLEEVSSVSG